MAIPLEIRAPAESSLMDQFNTEVILTAEQPCEELDHLALDIVRTSSVGTIDIGIADVYDGKTEKLRKLHHRLHVATGPNLALARDLASFARQRMSAGDASAGGEHMAAPPGLAVRTIEGEQSAVEATECQLMTGDVDDPASRSAELRTFRLTAWRDYVLAGLL